MYLLILPIMLKNWANSSTLEKVIRVFLDSIYHYNWICRPLTKNPRFSGYEEDFIRLYWYQPKWFSSLYPMKGVSCNLTPPPKGVILQMSQIEPSRISFDAECSTDNFYCLHKSHAAPGKVSNYWKTKKMSVFG